jgi:predicted TIM-barrel enzyme
VALFKQFTREEILERLHREIESGRPIVGAGAGIGITAKFAEIGGADLIVVYNSGLFRMNGHGSSAGSMPFGDANEIVLEMGLRSILPVVKNIPVIAGVCGTDVTRVMAVFLKQIREAGFSGVINFPTVGTLDGNFRQRLEDLGMGYEREVEMIRMARKMGLFTMSYTFNSQEARAMADADVDVLIAHLGLTTGGALGSKRAVALSEAVPRVQEILRAAKEAKREIICLAHGGPISSPEDTEYIYRHTDAVGFLGASSIERIPVEKAIQKATESFKTRNLKRRRD